MPNRSNYIHWIEDLLSSDIIPNTRAGGDVVKGFDVGTGANCIYPLLGASLLGWRFVGSGSSSTFVLPLEEICVVKLLSGVIYGMIISCLSNGQMLLK